MKGSFILLVTYAMPLACGANPADGSQDSSSSGSNVIQSDANNDSGTRQCTSGDYWTRGDHESALMHPGGECISCHADRHEGPRYSIAGTLYASPNDPTDCNGIDPSYSAKIVITDADGDEHALTVNSAGNFTLRDTIPTPYTAKVLYNGQERVMVTPQMIGDCNSCHSSSGANGAPGRVQLPL